MHEHDREEDLDALIPPDSTQTVRLAKWSKSEGRTCSLTVQRKSMTEYLSWHDEIQNLDVV